ncbi:MAG TPA: ABC transporter ATP-binding protein [Polyangiaceae bacterium]|nr:ABC transporter ATP-binding protein [Polyangiaceae bacterium]
MTALRVDAPFIGYAGAAPALRDVRFEMEYGECIALLGGNGAGKTAMLRYIAGLLPRAGGRCTLEGREIRSARDAVALGVGLVVQEPDDQLLGDTVRDDAEFGPHNLGLSNSECAQRVDQALAWVGLLELATREIESLSLGERKRASLAGVLAMRPRVLLLDEPTAGLDPQGERAICEILNQLRRAGCALLVATHAVDLIPYFASRVLVLGAGTIRADGACREILLNAELLEASRVRRPWALELWARLLAPHVPTPTLSLEEVLSCWTTESF